MGVREKSSLNNLHTDRKLRFRLELIIKALKSSWETQSEVSFDFNSVKVKWNQFSKYISAAY